MIHKQRNWPRTERRATGGKRFSSNKPIFRRRRRNAFFALGILAIFILLMLGASPLYAGLFSAESDTTVARIETLVVADAPEPVADLRAQARKQDAEQVATEEEAAQETADKEAAPPPPEDPTLYLTIPRLGIYSHTVRNDDSQATLDIGAGKIPSTGFPWQTGANTYIAGHRIGYPGTESYYQFYNLPAMQPGDAVYLTDANGTVYTYQVSEVFAVSPSDVWVTNPVAGRDMVSLQTCTETPNDWWTIGPKLFESGPGSGRLIVQADKVAVDYV